MQGRFIALEPVVEFVWRNSFGQGFFKLLYFAMDNTVHVEIQIEEIFHITRHNWTNLLHQRVNKNIMTPPVPKREVKHTLTLTIEQKKKKLNQHSKTWSEKIKPKVFLYKKNDLIRNSLPEF